MNEGETFFTVTQDFADEEMRSHYVAGLNYRVRPGNTKLAARLEAWIAAGVAQIINAPERRQAALSEVSGAVTVEGKGKE